MGTTTRTRNARVRIPVASGWDGVSPECRESVWSLFIRFAEIATEFDFDLEHVWRDGPYHRNGDRRELVAEDAVSVAESLFWIAISSGDSVGVRVLLEVARAQRRPMILLTLAGIRDLRLEGEMVFRVALEDEPAATAEFRELLARVRAQWKARAPAGLSGVERRALVTDPRPSRAQWLREDRSPPLSVEDVARRARLTVDRIHAREMVSWDLLAAGPHEVVRHAMALDVVPAVLLAERDELAGEIRRYEQLRQAALSRGVSKPTFDRVVRDMLRLRSMNAHALDELSPDQIREIFRSSGIGE